MGFTYHLALFLLLSAVSAQLSGHVGPTSSLESKQSTICNVLDYGGSIGSSDIGPAITSAFTVRFGPRSHRQERTLIDSDQDCVLNNSGSTLYVPAGKSYTACTRRQTELLSVPGDYDMQTWVTLSGGTQWAFRLDGLISRAGEIWHMSAWFTRL